jgi:YidC/Oxa1 family membrane protein insertase
MVDIWNVAILDPVLNGLIALSQVLWGNFGLAIIVLTIIVRIVLMPLTFRQTQSTKAMQSLQPKLQEIQKKYARDQKKLQQEMMRLYKEAGINPLGCMWPMLIQMPIWIALYQSIMQALAATPENLLILSQHLYAWDLVDQAIPLNENFLGLKLSQPDPTMILAILVGISMWMQQKMVTPPATDPRQQQMSSMTTMMMPMMFAFFTLSFPSGLALYWVVSNIIGIAIQYVVGGGWGYFTFPSLRAQPQAPAPTPQNQPSKALKEGNEKKKG